MTNSTARPGRRPAPSPADEARGDGLSRPDVAGAGAADGTDPSVPPGREPGVEADPESVARTIVLRQLTTTARTRSELATTLARRNVPDDVAAKVLDRMAEVGLIDDAGYAHEWVRQRHQGRGLARRALAHELRRKGIDDDLAAEALATVDDDDERAAARDLAERRARSSRGQPYDKRVRQLTGMLARKGYASGVVYAVVREVLAADGAQNSFADDDAGPLD